MSYLKSNKKQKSKGFIRIPLFTRRCCGLKRAGFTLIEILLALLIFTMICGSLYFGIRVGLKAIKRGRASFEVFQELRVCLRELQLDLRSLFPKEISGLEIFESSENFLSIICYKVNGLYKISYYQESGSLFRSVEKILFTQSIDNKRTIKFSKTHTAHLASLIETIDFEYLNIDNRWDSQWDAGNYPQAVRITFYFAEEEGNKYKFQSVISVPSGWKIRAAKK